MTYNMEPFMRSCVEKYLELSRSCGFNANLKKVATPFLPEEHHGSPQGKPNGSGPTLYCPECRHAFAHSHSIPDAEHRKRMQEFNDAISRLEASQEAEAEAKLAAMIAYQFEHDGLTEETYKAVNAAKATSNQKPKAAEAANKNVDDETKGVLAPIASRILLKLLYGARMARFDLC